MKKQRFTFFPAALLAAALLLSGCGASPKSQSSGMSVMEETAAETQAMSMDMGAMPRSGQAETEAGAGSLTGTDSVSPLPASNRKLIRNVSMDVETDKFEDLMSALDGRISELGGYIEQSDISGRHLTSNELSPRYASITARIPAAKLDGFIKAVEGSGNVVNKSQSTTDVTLQYSDIESKKKSLNIEQERLWALLEKAESMDAVVTLEQRLSEIRYELESMESQLRLYDNQVDYSTVCLYISEVKDFTPVKPESVIQRIQKGFSQNVKAVSNAFTGFMVSFLVLSPVWVTALLIVIFLIVIFRKGRKHVLKRAKPRFFKKKQGGEPPKKEEGQEQTGQ